MAKLIHYTINTADTFDCSSKEYGKDALKILHPVATLATIQKTARQKLPPPFDSYNVKVTTDDGCALFDIYDSDSILTTNAIAWTFEGQSECWKLFESLYLKLIEEMELVSISRAPQMPQSLP